jgi:hemolysin activation/secretion protein
LKPILRAAALLLMLAPGPASAQASADAAAERRVEVRRFQVEGSTLIPRARIDAALAPLAGQRTLAELRAAAETVQRLYAEAGWGGVAAYLPPQALQDGTLTIAVVEGKLAAVSVGGARDAAAEAAVRAAVPALEIGRTPRVREIDRQLQLANENPARRIQLLLKPGEQPGEIAAELTLRQRAASQFTLGADDTGSERTGRYRVGLAWQHADLTGAGDVASLQYQTAPGRTDGVAVLSAAYQRTRPAQLLAWQAYALYSDIEAGATATAAGPLRISGRGRIGGLRGQWLLPRWGEADPRLGAALEHRTYLNRCEVQGLPGACTGIDTEVVAVPLTLELALRLPGRWPASLSLAWVNNTGWGGARASAASYAALRSGADRRFAAWRLAGAWGTAGGTGWQAQARLNLQWTADALIGGEQFGLGGAASVRGYEERELVGDRGAVVALDVLSPPWLERATAEAPALRGLLFADAGTVANRLDTPCRASFTRCSIAGAGAGVVFEAGGWSARLALARALRTGPLTPRGDTRTHAAASTTF